MVSSVSQSYLRSAHHAEFRPAKTFSRDQLHVHNMQGLIKPKLKEGMQLNVNRQTAKCTVLLKIDIQERLQELTDKMGGSTQRTGSVISSYYV